MFPEIILARQVRAAIDGFVDHLVTNYADTLESLAQPVLHALVWLEQQGMDNIRRHELALTGRFLEGLRDIPKLRAVGRDGVEGRAAVVSVACEGMDPAFLADALGREYGVLTRVGLHCAPNAHKVLGTYPTGTVRFSFGPQNTEAHVDAALKALRELSGRDAWN